MADRPWFGAYLNVDDERLEFSIGRHPARILLQGFECKGARLTLDAGDDPLDLLVVS